ncbi:Nucleoporin-like protein [Emericellopsis cladophorae]|uniref:Nucleoporin-like protein n=1 Tax=Emericellopsis cladophorae TaxID=2686198 RepID=A0A9P9XW63_9HYPO|nr:Nucleoporin-like protein [Emericellopsis cladophorae]KAI6778668.1 Nucleoporin-like protein [Emericellopsis cladophorae]
MAATDVDLGYVAGHLGLDQPFLKNFGTQPTVELANAILQAIAAKAHEFDELYAAKLQTDIELESAVRSAESRTEVSQSTVEKALKDVQEAREKLREEENKRQAVESELQSLKAKTLSHDDEVKAFSDKIEALQSSNRTNLEIIETRNKQKEEIAEDLNKQYQRTVELSREITNLQRSEQANKAQLSSAEYREHSLKQQLDQARRSGEWFEEELKTKTQESLKYRKEKGARIAELQRQNEDAKSEIDALKKTEQQLRDRLKAMETKATEALVKVQRQESAFASQVESYQHELAAQKRLVDMSNSLSKNHQERIRDLETARERLIDNHESEVHRVRRDMEQERQSAARLEEKVQELERQIDELQVRAEQAPTQMEPPETPRHNGSTMPRPSSPFATPGSVRGKSSMSVTQAIEQVYQAKAQLANEKRRTQQLSEELDNMMSALEMKAPEIQELQSEVETLREEITRMSDLSQQSFAERDEAKRVARKAEAALSTAQTETKILRTQVRDLGTQIQYLVFNIHAMEKGQEKLTEEEKIRLAQLEKGEITEEALSDMSDTQQFITERLVVFKNIKALQEQNEEALRITRNLAEEMDSQENADAKNQAKLDHEKAERLEKDLANMADELKFIKKTMDSYKSERDMFKRLVQQRETAEGESPRPPLASIEGGEQTETLNDALQKVQSEYDQFREDSDSVRRELNNRIDGLTSEKHSLQKGNVTLQGEVRLEVERREMLQANFVALQSENVELKKRSQALSESAAKQDIRTQQVMEELIETKGLLDSTRNETTNLKAEKKFWNDIQDRMRKENEGLIEERNKLNDLIATHQSMENERSRSHSEERRKMQGRIDALERDLNEAQRKLADEAEDAKRLQQRKEFEGKESQKRIDELLANLSQIREEHVAVKTSRDHLQARVDEMTVELRSAEDRVGRLQPRPTPRPGTAVDTSEFENEILELNNEVADLKRELDLARTHLDNAKAQAEQFKELSQSNEETLDDIRSSHESYQKEMESLFEEKNAKIKELEQRIDDMSSELSHSNAELSSIRDSQGEITRRHQDEKAILEEEVARLKEDNAKHIETARYHQEDLRAQADIASMAQRNYDAELIKHAEAAKLAQQLRNECNEFKNQALELRSEADAAKVTLAQSESLWEDQRHRLEQEVRDLKARRDDTSSQTKLLYQQLESLTAQLDTLRQSRPEEEADDEAMSPVPMGDMNQRMLELNSYLRKEKEILEMQHHIKTEEAKRLQQQLDHAREELDGMRVELQQERDQSGAGAASSTAYNDLMGKLAELNTYRESTTTLRNENNRLNDLVAEKTKRVEDMEAKIQPLNARIATLEAQQTYLEEEIKQVKEDRDRWQKRTESILTQYGRVDPAEMDGLKEKVSQLETENTSLKEREQTLVNEKTELSAQVQKAEEQKAEMDAQVKQEEEIRREWKKSQTDRLNKKVKELREADQKKLESTREAEQKELQEAKEAKEAIEKELSASQQETATRTQEKSSLEEQLRGLQERLEAMGSARAEKPSEATASSAIVSQLEQQLSAANAELESVKSELSNAQQELDSLKAQMQTAVSERDATIEQLRAAASTSQSTENVDATKEVPATEPAAKAGLSDEERKQLEDKITALETRAKEFEEKASQLETQSRSVQDDLHKQLASWEKQAKEKDIENVKLRQDIALAAINNPEPAAPVPATPQSNNAPANNGTPAPATEPKSEDQGDKEKEKDEIPALDDLAPAFAALEEKKQRSVLLRDTRVKSLFAKNFEAKRQALEKEAKETGKREARDEAKQQAEMKSKVQINFAKNQLTQANVKLEVVRKAAEETPQKPVVEIWEVAKVAKPPPASAANGTPGVGGVSASPAATPQKPGAPLGKPAQQTPKASPVPSQAQGTSTPGGAPAGTPSNLPKNPFDVVKGPAASVPANPFSASTSSQPPTQGNQPPRTGIPMVRGARGRGGYTHPNQRAASGTQESGIPQAGRGGRGGGVPRGGRGGLNPGAQDFQSGTKRPRGDSDAEGGAKRARGAH